MFAMSESPEEPRGVRLTLREAAAACAVHHSTVRRHLDAGDFPNAARDADGKWRLPVSDLLGAGLRLSQPKQTVATVLPSTAASHGGDELSAARARVDTLLAELTAEKVRAAAAEARAAAMADNLADLRVSLRALAGPPAPQEPSPVVTTPQAPVDAPGPAAPAPVSAPAPEVRPADVTHKLPTRRRWWQRG